MLNELLTKIATTPTPQKPIVVALAGSVSVGKTTLAQQLADALQTQGLQVAVVSTDHFLLDNATLQAQGVFDQKGFPKTYRLTALNDMVRTLKKGARVEIPVYHQPDADIVPNQTQQITPTDVLIIEGVVALQMDMALVDWAIYVDAQMTDIERWYLERSLANIYAAADKPDSWYYQYRDMPRADLEELIMSVWRKTNLVNLTNYIAPSKAKAQVIIHKNGQHEIDNIAYL